MPDAPEKKWYEHDRLQGLTIAAAGVAMLFHPITNPVAKEFIIAGLGWAIAGAKNAAVRLVRKVKITGGATTPPGSP